MSTAPLFLAPEWPRPARVRAAFSLRQGGISAAPCDSLNLGRHVGDDPESVAANRRALRAALALPDEPQWLAQVHGARVVDLDAAWPLAEAEQPTLPEADAIVTRTAGRVLAIMVADCLPVLFAARDGSVIGAAHAGWRGLAAGVLEATVKAMGAVPSELTAWLGPCIRQPHFEVGDEVREAFLTPSADVADAAHVAAAFVANPRGRWQCDLPALARLRLQRAGVRGIADCGLCTFADRGRFFSHRRDQRTGRMAALLWLSP